MALRDARAGLAAVRGALDGLPLCLPEARFLSNAAFRSAQILVLSAETVALSGGRRWSRRHKAIRGLIEQNAPAGLDAAAGLASAVNGAQRLLLLELLALLSDLVYFLDVLGREYGGKS